MRDRSIIREALAVALEGLPEDASELASDRDVRRYLREFFKEFALRRGVIIEDADCADEIRALIAELRRDDTP
jgi:hypothetical protein